MHARNPGDAFARFVEVMLADGGAVAVLSSVEVYLDESQFLQDPEGLIVSGYVYDEAAAKEFGPAWQAVLDHHKLPYFRMSPFIGGFKPFDHLCEADRGQIQRTLTRLIHEHTQFGFSVVLNASAFRRLVTPNEIFPTPYSYAMFLAVQLMRKWAEREDFDGEVSYFFEQGYKGFEEAGAALGRLLGSDLARSRFKFGGHAFVKKQTPELHPADYLAWFSGDDFKQGLLKSDKPPRPEFISLLRRGDRYMLVRDSDLKALNEALVGGDKDMPIA